MIKQQINIVCPTKLATHIEYIAMFWNNFQGNTSALFSVNQDGNFDQTISYGVNASDHAWQIPKQSAIFDTYQGPFYSNAFTYQQKMVYGIGKEETPKANLVSNRQFGFDVFETIFFHLSRYEEKCCPPSQKNEWDMMAESQQFLVKNGLQHLPVVDQLTEAVFEVLGITLAKLKPQLTISHDIDYYAQRANIGQAIHFGLSLVKRSSSKTALFPYFWHLAQVIGKSKPDPFAFPEGLWQQADHNMVYLHLGGHHPYDNPSVTDQKLTSMIDQARKNNYTIGFHPSYLAASDAQLFQNELQRLQDLAKKPIVHSRQHFLHFDFEKTISLLENAGIKEDSSLGYNEHLGYRAGTAQVFYLWNWATNQVSTVKTRPLTWMDSANWYSVDKKTEHYLDAAKHYFDTNRAFDQCLCVHNTAWVNYRYLGLDLRKIYALFAKG